MSIHDERDLRAKLGSALDDFSPRPLPLQAVMGRGRAVMIRRRLAAVAAAAAVIAAAVVAPTLLHTSQPTPPAAPHYHATVHQPGPGSPRGLIASGLVNRARWQLTVRYDAHRQLCYASVPGFNSCGTGAPSDGRSGAPASLFGDPNQAARNPDGRGVQVQMLYGIVRRDVDHLRVDLSNGQVLVLHPVAVLGSRYASYVALAVPFASAVSEISAYSASGILARTVPFTAAGSIEVVRWLAPGQPVLPMPTTRRIGSGVTSGSKWSVRAHVGPWGICFTSAAVGMDLCSARAGVLQPGRLLARMALSHAGHLSLGDFQVARQVRYLTVARVRGADLRIAVVLLGGRRYCVIPADDHNHDVSWTAYDAFGRRLGGGAASALWARG
jgi:hypothetical protein